MPRAVLLAGLFAGSDARGQAAADCPVGAQIAASKAFMLGPGADWAAEVEPRAHAPAGRQNRALARQIIGRPLPAHYGDAGVFLI